MVSSPRARAAQSPRLLRASARRSRSPHHARRVRHRSVGDTSLAKTLTVEERRRELRRVESSRRLAGNHPGDFILSNDLCNNVTLATQATAPSTSSSSPRCSACATPCSASASRPDHRGRILRGTADPVNTITITPRRRSRSQHDGSDDERAAHVHREQHRHAADQPDRERVRRQPIRRSSRSSPRPTRARGCRSVAGTCSISVVFAPDDARREVRVAHADRDNRAARRRTVTGNRPRFFSYRTRFARTAVKFR